MSMAAKKQAVKKITSSFLGDESSNQELLAKGKLLKFSPNVEFFTNTASEYLAAVVRTKGDAKNNPVYRITDVKLINIIESFAETVDGVVFYYKIPIN